MNARDEQFLVLYQRHRFEDQQRWYDQRRAEFDAAHSQVVTLTAGLMVLAAAALASADVGGLKLLWSVLAVVFPGLSTALAAYNGLYAFEQQAKLYRDAANTLLRAGADVPTVQRGLAETGYRDALRVYIEQTEGIFRREQGQWGQLVSEIKPIEPRER
jgi:SMODS and SLOG-associating 2TM effector domain 1